MKVPTKKLSLSMERVIFLYTAKNERYAHIVAPDGNGLSHPTNDELENELTRSQEFSSKPGSFMLGKSNNGSMVTG